MWLMIVARALDRGMPMRKATSCAGPGQASRAERTRNKIVSASLHTLVEMPNVFNCAVEVNTLLGI